MNRQYLNKLGWIFRVYAGHVFRELCIAAATPLNGILPEGYTHRAFRFLLLAVPPSLRGARFRHARANLVRLGIAGAHADLQARLHLATQLAMEVSRRQSAVTEPLLWRNRLASTHWQARPDFPACTTGHARMILLLNTGDQHLAAACVIEQHSGPGQFFIDLPCAESGSLRSTLLGLRQFGHRIEFCDMNDRMRSITILRRLSQGSTVLATLEITPADLWPDSTQAANEALIKRCKRNLLAVGLANLAGVDVVLAAHQVSSSGKGYMHAIQTIQHGDLHVMTSTVINQARHFVSEHPESWQALGIRADPLV